VILARRPADPINVRSDSLAGGARFDGVELKEAVLDHTGSYIKLPAPQAVSP